ncbi:LysR substrate-binding domain-containing protein [Ideonella sp.]|uniref:LysR substrate-binding domain-containing protein n=1 Tax=Ideonella sp. TaxID=1929293 RepID=UPI003BB737F5
MRRLDPVQRQHVVLPARMPLALFTLPSLAATWLIPRLADLAAQAPQVQLTLHTGYELHSLPPLQPAVALRVGRFERHGLRLWPLWRDRLVAVASPAWTKLHGSHPKDWPAGQRLRHLDQAWPCQLAGQRLPPAEGLGFNDALLLVQATLNGLGVAWTRRALVAPWLSTGGLLQLAQEPEAASERSTWLVCRDELADEPAVRLFVEWLLHQTICG